MEKGIRAIQRKKICKPADIAAIGITNQRETAMLWDRQTGQPLNNAIVWQCRRTTDFCAQLKAAGHEPAVRRNTGLVLDPYFSASKFRWLLQQTTGIGRKLKANRVAAGTIDSYLVWQLTKGDKHVTDVSNASRTSLMNLKSRRWDKRMLELFQVSDHDGVEFVPALTGLGAPHWAPEARGILTGLTRGSASSAPP